MTVMEAIFCKGIASIIVHYRLNTSPSLILIFILIFIPCPPQSPSVFFLKKVKTPG